MQPQYIGPYEVLAPLGAGGMGDVFLAHDTRLDRKVAIKRVRASAHSDSQRQILREARTVAHLNHPNIATVFDVVEHDSVTHIVMEYVEGETLAKRLRSGPLTPPEALGYVRQITDALAYAHSQGITHCDIKPSNVIIRPDGRAQVLDFGIARFEDTLRLGGDKTTAPVIVRGTPAYMAPELRLGAQPSSRSDVYSVGVLLFELLTKRRPYEGIDPAKLLNTGTEPPSLSDMVPTITAALSDLVSRAIAPDPQRRIGSIEELKAGLDEVTTVTEAVPAGRLSFAWRWATPAIALVAASVALLSGVVNLPGGRRPPHTPAVMGVLIFNTTDDEKNDYLGAGLTDSLVASLSAAPGLTIVPRTSVVAYLSKPTDVKKAAHDLGLTHVMTGGVQRSSERLLVTMNLLKADQSPLWSGSFDGSVADVFHLQQRVAAGVLKALRAQGFVTADLVAQARSHPTTSNPDAFEAFSHGRVLLDRSDVPGNVDRALALFEQAVKLDPLFVRAHAAIGEAAWLKYRFTKDARWVDRARASTMEALRLAPDDPSVRYALAVIEHGTGHPDAAIATLEQVLDAQPASDDAHRLLGRIYSERRDFSKAIEELREALKIRPDYPTNVRALGLAYFDQGKLNDAIAMFTRVTELQPDNASAFQNLGTAYHAAGQFDRALIAYERASSLAPSVNSLSNIGILHHARRDYDGAIAAYRKSLALQPKNAATHRNLADSLWAAGNRSAARAEYEKAIDAANESLKINAADPRTRALIAICEAKLGHAEAARRLIQEALAAAPNDSDIVYKQALIETVNGDLEQGLAALQRALQLGYSATMLGADRDLDPLRKKPGFPVSH